MNIVFFGSSKFSVYVLDELKKLGILPNLVVTTPDKPKGRKLVLSPTPVKVWAGENNIEVLDPSSLKNNQELVSQLSAISPQLFLVASYGKIIPKEIFETPTHKTLNIHPSLLPKYRGASPTESQILNNEKEIGVSIMRIDEEMDHGPVIAQTPLPREADWPPKKSELEKLLAVEGARLFAEITPKWIVGEVEAKPQDETQATYCTKIKKENGLIDLEGNPEKNLLKIKAYEGWPSAYCFLERGGKKIRVIIKEAVIENGKLKIERLVPEGRKEMSWEDFLRGQK